MTEIHRIIDATIEEACNLTDVLLQSDETTCVAEIDSLEYYLAEKYGIIPKKEVK